MPDTNLPSAPIDRIVGPLSRFLHIQAASGAVLLVCSLTALWLANSPWSEAYLGFWKTEVSFSFGDFEFRHSLKHLINDGLMTIFFFVVGLEVKREFTLGELRDTRRASLPIAAALGGMIIPAVVYLICLWGREGQRGWGIPMATDIAFVVGCMAILGSRVPHQLRITVLSLAIADDIGAILVIALGYTEQISFGWLTVGVVVIGLVLAFARLGVRSITAYVLLGAAVWFAFHESGIHATIAGVILGLLTPTKSYISQGLFHDVLARTKQVFEGEGFKNLPRRADRLRAFQRVAGETISPVEMLEHKLHPWSSFLIMPIFALANAGVPIRLAALGEPVAVAVLLGLAVGKPIGIVSFSWIAVKLGIARLPEQITWGIMFAAGCLAGIGFTMSLFIAELALTGPLLDTAKIGVLEGSVLAAVVGMTLLLILLPRKKKTQSNSNRSENRD